MDGIIEKINKKIFQFILLMNKLKIKLLGKYKFSMKKHNSMFIYKF
jgi:hypothetical protein